MSTATRTKASDTADEPSPFAPYAPLFDAAQVAEAETERFASVRDRVRTWVEQDRCHSVAVGPARVIRPRVFVAEVRSRSGTALLTRLFPPGEQYDRRFGVGDSLVVMLAAVWTSGQRERRCSLFRQREDQ